VADADDTKGYTGTTVTTGTYRRTLTLSNGSVIWDLSGNMGEQVNKSNLLSTTNPADFASPTSWTGSACGATAGYYSFSGDDGVGQCAYAGQYSYASVGPLRAGLNAGNGIGRIYSSTTPAANVFLR